MQGIILAGGSGTRLDPFTRLLSKHFLLIYNKLLFFYPLSLLMLMGIKNIHIISDPINIDHFKSIIGNGEDYGIRVNYIIQSSPNGIAESLILNKEINKKDDVALILGDNIFYGSEIHKTILKKAKDSLKKNKGLIVFVENKNPEDFGVGVFDNSNKLINLEEKPNKPKSNQIITGLYFYPKNTYKKVEIQKPNPKKNHELCITDLNKSLLNDDKLDHICLGRGFSWFDTGTYDGYLEASNFIKIVENKSDELIGSIEEVSYKNKWISKKNLYNLANRYRNKELRNSLLKIYK